MQIFLLHKSKSDLNFKNLNLFLSPRKYRNYMEAKDYLSVKDLMKLLPLKRSHIYSLINQNKIPFYKIGGLFLFDKKEIMEWFEQSKNTVNKG